VLVSLKRHGEAPGDASAAQMEALASLADQYSFGMIRVTHDQNLVLADVPQQALSELWRQLDSHGLATANIGTLTDMICCPGLDFCSLANAGSIPIAKQIQARFDDLDFLYGIGPLEIKMSGCMNACGHHHIGHIGILGVDKHGQEWYQITIGGSSAAPAALGQVIGPAVAKEAVADTISKLLEVYLRERRGEEERFVDTVRRIGIEPFQERVYAADHSAA
jgi:sulfite reductase (NADPH) hemoprotein beta-component